MNKLMTRAYHLWERIAREGKQFPFRCKTFGIKVAVYTFFDGIIPPGKHEWYIKAVSDYVDGVLYELTQKYKIEEKFTELEKVNEIIPIWCCWWQGEETMPELVKMCYQRLKQVIPSNRANLHLITLDNYERYVDLPKHIIEKFQRGIISMTTMSDILRFHLLEKYGGYWLDATVYFTANIPEEYFSGDFYCQRMVSRKDLAKREACGCNWCGFSMAGPKNNVVFRFMNDAFSLWWEKYDMIIDYVLIDYILLSGFRHVPAIHSVIDKVPDNNEDIFELYKFLNQPFSEELYDKLTERNVMHKLTYKMELRKVTMDGQMTLYGFLWNQTFSQNTGKEGKQ